MKILVKVAKRAKRKAPSNHSNRWRKSFRWNDRRADAPQQNEKAFGRIYRRFTGRRRRSLAFAETKGAARGRETRGEGARPSYPYQRFDLYPAGQAGTRAHGVASRRTAGS